MTRASPSGPVGDADATTRRQFRCDGRCGMLSDRSTMDLGRRNGCAVRLNECDGFWCFGMPEQCQSVEQDGGRWWRSGILANPFG